MASRRERPSAEEYLETRPVLRLDRNGNEVRNAALGKNNTDICGAKNRVGLPCQLAAGWGTDHPGSGRCKFHGGKSTGAKTKEGRKKLSEINKDNKNSEKTGLFSRFLPTDLKGIYEQYEKKDVVDILKETIAGQALAIARANELMAVKDAEDHTVEVVSSGIGEGGGINKVTKTHYARDKYAAFLMAQSKAVDSLSKMVKTLTEIEEPEEDDNPLQGLVEALNESRKMIQEKQKEVELDAQKEKEETETS